MHRLDRWAAQIGAADVFVLRHVGGKRYAHLGGVGRGVGWAGIALLDADSDPVAADLCAATVRRYVWSEPHHVFGPYWAAQAVLVRLSHDEVVVFGTSDEQSGISRVPDEELLDCARFGAQAVGDVSPAKRLGDELELLHAVQELAGRRPGTVAEAMAAISDVAATALSCEAAAVYVPGRPVAVRDRGWAPPVDLTVVMAELFPQVSGVVCTQDAGARSVAPALATSHGVRSHLLVPIGTPAQALLLAVHTESTPRGFTELCQQLGTRLGEVADMHLSTTLVREEMQEALRESRLAARRDVLTGLGNRLAWEEACAGAAERVAAGHGYGIVVADLDNLKVCNDRYGHAAGDELIVRFARRIGSLVREGDLAFRTGGDEVAVLLPSEEPAEAAAIAERLRRALSSMSGPGEDVPLGASVGHAWCAPGGSVVEAVRAADEAMYAVKASTRLLAPVPDPREAPAAAVG